VLGVAVVALGACGSDSNSDDSAAKSTSTTAAVTPAEWMSQTEAACPAFTPAFDGFYAQHGDTPDAAAYAEFLPSQVDGIAAMADCIEGRPAPDVIAAEVDAVVSAMRVVEADFETALESARNDELTAVDARLTQMRDVDVPAIDAAMGALKAKTGA
jgi:hypothetical protein